MTPPRTPASKRATPPKPKAVEAWCLVGPEGFRLSSLTFDDSEKDIPHVEGYRVARCILSESPIPARRARAAKKASRK